MDAGLRGRGVRPDARCARGAKPGSGAWLCVAVNELGVRIRRCGGRAAELAVAAERAQQRFARHPAALRAPAEPGRWVASAQNGPVLLKNGYVNASGTARGVLGRYSRTDHSTATSLGE